MLYSLIQLNDYETYSFIQCRSHTQTEGLLRHLEINIVSEDTIHLFLRAEDNETELERITLTGKDSKDFLNFINGETNVILTFKITSGSIKLTPVNEATGHIELDIITATGDKEKCTFPIQHKAVKEGKYF